MRRVAVCLLARRNVSHHRYWIAVLVIRVQPCRSITATRHPFGRVQAKQVSARDPVQHAPDFMVRIGANIGWRSLPFWSPLQVEAQSISADTPNAPFQRSDPSSLNKCSFIHVGAVREVPDLVRWPPFERKTVTPIVPARHHPGPREQSSPSNSHIWLSAIQRLRLQRAADRSCLRLQRAADRSWWYMLAEDCITMHPVLNRAAPVEPLLVQQHQTPLPRSGFVHRPAPAFPITWAKAIFGCLDRVGLTVMRVTSRTEIRGVPARPNVARSNSALAEQFRGLARTQPAWLALHRTRIDFPSHRRADDSSELVRQFVVLNGLHCALKCRDPCCNTCSTWPYLCAQEQQCRLRCLPG